MFFIKHIFSDSLVSCIVDTQIVVFNMITNMWSPYIVNHSDLSLQEEPLDLSMKTQVESGMGQKAEVKNQERSFDLWKFYQTYHQISSRSLTYYHAYNGLAQPFQTSPSITRKRKSSSSSIESEGSESGDEKKIRIEMITGNCKSNYSPSQKKSEKVSQIANIKDSCDCRFCYEDHIIKMRLKTEKPWNTFFAQ